MQFTGNHDFLMIARPTAAESVQHSQPKLDSFKISIVSSCLVTLGPLDGLAGDKMQAREVGHVIVISV